MPIARTYNRISEEDREKTDTSIPNQISMNTAMAEHIEAELDKNKPHYIAKNEKSWPPIKERKILWQAYQDAIKEEYDILIVKDLDRLARGRNLEIIKFMFDQIGIKIVSCSEETSTKNLIVKGFMGAWYVQEFREKALLTQRKKIETGLPIGKAPYGYNNKRAKWVINKNKADKVLLCFANAYKNRKYTDTIANLGISKKLYYKIIKNPAYIGIIKFTKKIRDPDGKTIEKKEISYKGIHQPIISEEFFNKINRN